MNVDKDQRDRAIERLANLGGLTQANAATLTDAALAGAMDQAFELINGSSAVPTSMTTSKADQLRFICDRAGRLLSQREVEILFRVTATSARSILTTMLATYEEALREKFLARMRDDAKVIASGTEEAGLTWTLRFSESSTLDAAWAEVMRLGLAGDAEVHASATNRHGSAYGHPGFEEGEDSGGARPGRSGVGVMRQTLADQVAQAANLLGLLLALVTLFTSEQARRLGDERTREGGAHPERLKSIRYACAGLCAVTIASLTLLGPLALDVVKAIGTKEWEPVLGVFVLAYLLLAALLCWQVVIGAGTSSG